MAKSCFRYNNIASYTRGREMGKIAEVYCYLLSQMKEEHREISGFSESFITCAFISSIIISIYYRFLSLLVFFCWGLVRNAF